MCPPQPGPRTGTIVYNYVTVETETDSYENVVAVHRGDAVGIVPDPAELEREYGRGGGPDPDKLFNVHSRYVVPWRRVVEIDRAGGDRGATRAGDDRSANSASGPDGTDDGPTTGEDGDGDASDDDPDDVFDEI